MAESLDFIVVTTVAAAAALKLVWPLLRRQTSRPAGAVKPQCAACASGPETKAPMRPSR